MKQATSVVVIAGFLFFAMAVSVMFALPWTRESSWQAEVKGTDGRMRTVRPYTAQELHGRAVYIREGCWYCHSQYVRPVAGEARRWGPVSQAGEYAYDQPQMFGTRRIGPDLTREGGAHSDDWHYAHHFNPRLVVPDSIMPAFPWLFKGKDAAGKPIPTQDMIDLVAYMQHLGTGIGDWRDDFVDVAAGSTVHTDTSGMNQEAIDHGKAVYERRCIGCHGVNGDGNGPAAVFLFPKPRDFRPGTFKFKSTAGGDLPTDADVYRTVTRGLRGTAMPSWHTLPEQDRWEVIAYIKTFPQPDGSPSRFATETPSAPFQTPPDPDVVVGDPVQTKTLVTASAERGGKLYYDSTANCYSCHGGAPDGSRPPGLGWADKVAVAANAMKDDWNNPIFAADFTRALKSGSKAGDIFQVITLGVTGAPMPSFQDTLSDRQRWDLAHFIMVLKAARDVDQGDVNKVEPVSPENPVVGQPSPAPTPSPSDSAPAAR